MKNEVIMVTIFVTGIAFGPYIQHLLGDHLGCYLAEKITGKKYNPHEEDCWTHTWPEHLYGKIKKLF